MESKIAQADGKLKKAKGKAMLPKEDNEMYDTESIITMMMTVEPVVRI